MKVTIFIVGNVKAILDNTLLLYPNNNSAHNFRPLWWSFKAFIKWDWPTIESITCNSLPLGFHFQIWEKENLPILHISRNFKNDSANRLKITIYSLGLVSKASVLNYWQFLAYLVITMALVLFACRMKNIIQTLFWRIFPSLFAK